MSTPQREAERARHAERDRRARERAAVEARERLAARAAGLEDPEPGTPTRPATKANTKEPASGRRKGGLEDRREVAAKVAELRHRRGSRERPRPRLRPLVADLIDAGTLFFVAGKPGHGKSHVVADLGCAIATGRDFAGRKVQPGPVVFLVGEGEGSFRDRLEAWQRLRHGGETIPYADLMVLPGAEDLRDPESVAARAMVQVVAEVGPSAVFIDTLNRYTSGADENAAKEMGPFLTVAAAIQAGPTTPAVGIVHHTTKTSEELRGSSALLGGADTVLHVKKDEPGRFVVTEAKQRNRDEGTVGTFGLEPSAWLEVDAEGEEIAVESVAALWDEGVDETNHVPTARPLEVAGMNTPGLSMAEAVLVAYMAMGAIGLADGEVVKMVKDYRSGNPQTWEIKRAMSRHQERKSDLTVTRVPGTKRWCALPGSTMAGDPRVAEAAAALRAEFEKTRRAAAGPTEDAAGGSDADE